MTQEAYISIVVGGNDAAAFLQGQLTNDLRRLSNDENQILLSAWCNPKGRVICLFRVREIDEGYELSVPGELADAVIKRLSMFRFRADVEFGLRGVDAAALDIEPTVDDWCHRNLLNGIPEIWQQQSEQYTPHMLNLDLLNAVSLDKGCYTGQEIVARTHYRGASKRRLLRFTSSDPISAGDEVLDGERKVGDVVNAIDTDLLAVVSLDKADESLTVAGAELTRQSLPYI